MSFDKLLRFIAAGWLICRTIYPLELRNNEYRAYVKYRATILQVLPFTFGGARGPEIQLHFIFLLFL